MKGVKGVSPLISTVIIISITITSIGAVLLIANPQINRARAGMTINEAKENMKIIDDTIRQVASEGTSAQRSLTLKTSDGGFIVRNSTGIEYILDTDFNYVPVRSVITDGRIRTTSGMSTLGLVGYWRFDEGGGTVANDSSGKGNSGNVTATWTAGKYGNALEFDGSGNTFVNISTNAIINADAGTIEMWLKTKNLSTQKHAFWAGDNDCGDGFGDQVEMHISLESDNTFWFYILNATTDVDKASPSSSSVVNSILFYHITATWVGGEVKIYVNGTLEGTDNNVPIPINKTNWLNYILIGRSCGTFKTRFWNGTIDEVKIYNRALNSTEVQDNFNLPPNKLKISLDYDNIIIKGTARWGKGTSKICIEKLGTQSNKALIEVRTC